MEYTQMTLTEWVDMKQKLRQELLGVKQSFVRIGYALRKIDDQKLYEQDGYKSVAEFAKAEYGLEGSTVSRFMAINREYSIDGYSERLRPEYLELGRSQLEEMLKLPESDRQMIQPETSREDIRELKRFNREAPAAGEADDLTELVRQFWHDDRETLIAVHRKPEAERTVKWFSEAVNPSGNRSYRKGVYFLMMYENRISVKKFGTTPKDMTWEEFYQLTLELLESAALDFEEPEKGEEHGTEKTDTAGEKAGKADSKKPAESSDKPERTQSQGEGIAPAQKSAENLEKNESTTGPTQPEEQEEDHEVDEEERESHTDQTETGEKAPERVSPEERDVEVLEKEFGTRKEYMDNLTVHEMAKYMADEYEGHRLRASDLAYPGALSEWLGAKVDRYGQPVKEG